jgi:ribosomal-protein-alanine N-acetyltransferase
MEKIILRNYKESDLNEMHRLWSNKEIMYYLEDIWCETIETTSHYLKTGMKNVDGHYFCICEKGADRFIGSIGYTITDETPLGKNAHMGYMLFPEFRGRCYMPEAVKKALEFAFTQDNCIRITTGCHKENDASRKVIEKSGFRKEAEKIEAVYHDGKMKDRLEYALNKNEYLSPIEISTAPPKIRFFV